MSRRRPHSRSQDNSLVCSTTQLKNTANAILSALSSSQRYSRAHGAGGEARTQQLALRTLSLSLSLSLTHTHTYICISMSLHVYIHFCNDIYITYHAVADHNVAMHAAQRIKLQSAPSLRCMSSMRPGGNVRVLWAMRPYASARGLSSRSHSLSLSLCV